MIQKNNHQSEKEALSNYARYSSIAIQMVSIIIIGTFGGHYLDVWIGWKFPVLTIILSVSSVFLSIYIVVKDLLKKK